MAIGIKYIFKMEGNGLYRSGAEIFARMLREYHLVGLADKKIDLISHYMVVSHNIILYHQAVHHAFKVVCE